MPDPVPDENGRLPGVDYSSQSWSIAGQAPVMTLEEAMTLIEVNEEGTNP